MIGDRTYRWAWRQATGSLRLKNLIEHTVGYTETLKKVAAASTTAVHAAVNSVVAGQTVTSGFTNPDVPRNITLTFGGTTADIAAGTAVVTGTNVEGKVITENISIADNQTGTLVGNKAFKTVTSLQLPAADNTGATIAVGYGSKLGLNHKLVPGVTSIIVVQDTAVDGSAPTVQAAPSASTIDNEDVELNTVTPATLPNGTTFLTMLYWYHKIQVAEVNDMDLWSTSTSTSSSSTSTSSSSTSTSTSSTSSSTSSTSTSTSSTSTSTTTIA